MSKPSAPSARVWALSWKPSPESRDAVNESAVVSIRNLVTAGAVSRACRLLGSPFALEGKVVPGQGIGSKQTVPTLNLDPLNEVLPKTGVYVTRTRDLDSTRSWKSITNIGYRPTFNGDSLTIETFLLDPLSDPTPVHIEVSLPETPPWTSENSRTPPHSNLRF